VAAGSGSPGSSPGRSTIRSSSVSSPRRLADVAERTCTRMDRLGELDLASQTS
jgi:hypothetical protein